MSKPSKWEAAVRSYEVDSQGIVNNSVYLDYFNHTRVLHLRTLGIDWFTLHQQGFDIVIANTELSFKTSLKAFDNFYITTEISHPGKVILMCHQTLFLSETQRIATTAVTKLACVEVATGKLCLPKALKEVATAI